MTSTERHDAVRRPRLVVGWPRRPRPWLPPAGAPRPSTSTTTTAPKLTGSITVSAASSLTDAFTQLGTIVPGRPPRDDRRLQLRFVGRAGHPDPTRGTGRRVRLGLPGGHGRPCSRPVTSTGQPVIFARNSLEIVVKPGNPLGIHSLADLTKANVVAICVSSAPCGATAEQALKKAHVTMPASKVTLGQDVDTTFAGGDHR